MKKLFINDCRGGAEAKRIFSFFKPIKYDRDFTHSRAITTAYIRYEPSKWCRAAAACEILIHNSFAQKIYGVKKEKKREKEIKTF